ncbi:MAG TPA: cupin domain-containing protein [Caulobacteraceae bacterium]|jgi:quercetin dioxygenase-like cupin family protein|nr:cupin domain-containing protein [Caulobacteraceae bacterium]
MQGRVVSGFVAACLLGTAPTVIAAPLDLRADVVPQTAPQEVRLIERDVAAGESTGWHLHHGVEMTYVLSGDLRLEVAGQAVRTLHAGDSFEVPRDTPHRASNDGPAVTALIISYLIDKGPGATVRLPPPRP